jgi:membrane associated rhomboid family serine protease
VTPDPAAAQRCYRHPDRDAYISCQRCERLICPDCMRDASVGFQCPSCIAEGSKSVRSARTMAGGLVSSTAGRVSMVLIAINVAAYVLQVATGGFDGEVYRQGAMLAETRFTRDGAQLTGVADGAWWRLVTSAFLHGGLLHLAFNMYALYLFGPFVERALGAWRFAAGYLTMAVFSSVVVYVLSPPGTTTVGASGAIFGLFALTLVLQLRARVDVTGLLVLLGINAVLSLRANISWQGHLGGFLAGLVLGAAVAWSPKRYRQHAQVAAVAVLVLGGAIALWLRTDALVTL